MTDVHQTERMVWIKVYVILSPAERFIDAYGTRERAEAELARLGEGCRIDECAVEVEAPLADIGSAYVRAAEEAGEL